MEKKIFKKLMQMDTVTRYEMDGSIIITPEEWHQHEQVCDFPVSYKARVKVSKNGKAVIRAYKKDSPAFLRYEELYCNEQNGIGCRIRRTQEHIIVRLTVKRDQLPAQIRRQTHDGYLDAAGWMKGAGEKLSE
ncbi:MAG: hypothetical protein IJ845_11420 [Bacteroidaceae bacterium]|nr:hypothetical protein [Bacteroidaceae bacterium]